MKKVSVVIGKNFGDEGKGLVTDLLCTGKQISLVIKHNGGAQAGHTVENEKGRFVFHQLSSGSFQRAHTLWARTYFPDLYKLGDEVCQFHEMAGCLPDILCDYRTPMVIIDDVLVNMALETMRGKNRHGSCGMGINESYVRTSAGFGITVADALAGSACSLAVKLKEIRKEYVLPRIKDLMITAEYKELLHSDTVLENVAEAIMKNGQYVTITQSVGELVNSYENIVFESGQGLLLDSEYLKFAPHLTTSRTGLANPVGLAKEMKIQLTDVYYVTRSYVTRHGAGPLPCECDKIQLGKIGRDLTNVPNPWQGELRYAPHVSLSDFVEPVHADLKNHLCMNRSADPSVFPGDRPKLHLFITHLNETNGKVCFEDGNVAFSKLREMDFIRGTFDECIGSDMMNCYNNTPRNQ